eukprot:6195485-Pleurochrysis_carterae.AAC.1
MGLGGPYIIHNSDNKCTVHDETAGATALQKRLGGKATKLKEEKRRGRKLTNPRKTGAGGIWRQSTSPHTVRKPLWANEVREMLDIAIPTISKLRQRSKNRRSRKLERNYGIADKDGGICVNTPSY